MAAVVLQVVSRPLPGADMSVVIGNMKEAAELWRKTWRRGKVLHGFRR